jgi:DNA-binding MarR family transcriptional regulator
MPLSVPHPLEKEVAAYWNAGTYYSYRDISMALGIKQGTLAALIKSMVERKIIRRRNIASTKPRLTFGDHLRLQRLAGKK